MHSSSIADVLTIFGSWSDTLKLAVLLMPPVFILIWRALSLHHQRAMRRAALDHLPITREDIALINARHRSRQLDQRGTILFEAMDAEADLARLRTEFQARQIKAGKAE